MNACAFLVGPPDGPTLALTALAHHAGLEVVRPYAGIAQAEQQSKATPICFFLFASTVDVTALAPVVQSIRFNRHRALHFAPLIYFAEDTSVESTQKLMGMGFDDVLTLPFTPARVRQRLVRQLDKTISFFETKDYVGPRRLDQTLATPLPGAAHQIETRIVRDLTRGIRVLRQNPRAIA